MSIQIALLPREQYKGYPLPFIWQSDEHFRVALSQTDGGWEVSLRREPLPEAVSVHTTEFLYQDYWPTAQAYGAWVDGELSGAIEFFHETWNNRLRVTNLAVLPQYTRRGVGTALMDRAKAQARVIHCRAVVLETQTRNVRAIAFYRAQGFEFTGVDLTAYSNEDVARGEVRLELVYRL